MTVLVHNTEVYYCRCCVVVDQCAYPDIALQIANRVAQSGNARVNPCTTLGGFVLPAGNTHRRGRLRGQRNRRPLFVLTVGQSGGLKVQRDFLVRILLIDRRIMYFKLCRLLECDIDNRVRSDRQFKLAAAENSAVRVLLDFGCAVIARNCPLLYNIAFLRRCRKGNLGSAEYRSRCKRIAVCRGGDRAVGIALRRYRVELVGELNVYIQILLQTRNRQCFVIIRKGVIATLGQILTIGFNRPLPNLIVFCRRSGENHIAAADDLGTADKGGRIITLITLQCAIIAVGIGDLVGIRLHNHHGVVQCRLILGEEFRLFLHEVGLISVLRLVINHADIVYTCGIVGRHTLCLEQICVIIVVYKVLKLDSAVSRIGSRNRDRLFAYRDVLACQHLALRRSGNAIGARNKRFTGFPICHRRRAVLVGGVGDAGLFWTGSTVDRHALEAWRNRVAISAVAYRNLIEIVCRLGIVGNCAAARTVRFAVAAENRHNAVNAGFARCPLALNRRISGGLAYRIAYNAAGGRVSDLERDRAVVCGGRIRFMFYRCGQRNFIAQHLRLAAGGLDLGRYGCAGLEQLAVRILIQTSYQRQAGVGAITLRVVGAVQLVDGKRSRVLAFCSIGQNRIAVLGHINGCQAVCMIGVGVCIADGICRLHFNGRTIAILAIIFTILTI